MEGKMKYIVERLSKIEPFAYIEETVLEEAVLGSDTAIGSYDKNQMVYIQEEECRSMDIVIKGAVDINSIDLEGKLSNLARFKEGDILGVNLLFSSKNRYPFSVVAVEDCQIIKVPKKVLLELSKENPDFTESLLTIVSDKALALAKWITNISLKPLREKIMDYIEYEKRIQGKNKVDIPTTKKEIAERLGVQRTSLSRELQKMKKDGIIEYDRSTITLL